MSKSLNSRQQLLCSLCGEYYIEAEGHDYNDCVGRIKLQLHKVREIERSLEQKYTEADKRRPNDNQTEAKI